MRHLGQADYRRMPWANGRGTTVELIRVNRPDGALLWRLSMARVIEDGPFSLFPGIDRNLTVISGPGFGLESASGTVRARPLVPVAFPGDVPIRATGTGNAPSDDFNVMTDRSLPQPRVTVMRGGSDIIAADTVCVFALDAITVDGQPMQPHDLAVANGILSVSGPGARIVLRLSV